MPTGSGLRRLTATASLVAAAGAGLVTLAPPAGAVPTAATAYLRALNTERVNHGLRPLTMRTDLNAVAQRWANHMAGSGLLAHNPKLTTQVRNWQVVGENVGDGPTIPALTAAFWASAPHRDNILDRSYRDVGIGTATSHGIIWITVDFRAPMNPEPSSTVARPRTTRTAPAVHRTLRVGSRGRDVRFVQRHVHVRADGIFGPRTRHAVVRFQRRHHLRANGIVGVRTWRALHHHAR